MSVEREEVSRNPCPAEEGRIPARCLRQMRDTKVEERSVLERSVREVRRGWDREFTTHDKHKLVDLSTNLIHIYIVLVFGEWAHWFERPRKKKKTNG